MKSALRISMSVVLFGASAGVLAQTAPAVAPLAGTPTAAAIVIAPNTCVKPALGIQIDQTAAQEKRKQRQVDDYKKCITDYASTLNSTADVYSDISKRYNAAGNAAIEEYNATIKEIRAQQDRDKE